MWLLLALSSAVILATRKIQEKHLVGNIGPALGWMLRLTSGVSALILWVIFSRDMWGMTHPVTLMVIAAVTLIYPLQTYCYYTAMHHMPLSLFGMLAGVVPLTSLVLSYIFLDAPISFFWIVGIWLTVIGIAVLSYRHTRSDIALTPILLALAAYGLFWVWSVLDRIALTHIAPTPYTVLNQLVWALSIFLYTHFILRDTKMSVGKENLKIIFLIGFTISISWILSSHALLTAPNPGYVAALQNTHILMTTFYGVFILKEKMSTKKIIAFCLFMTAIITFAFA